MRVSVIAMALIASVSLGACASTNTTIGQPKFSSGSSILAKSTYKAVDDLLYNTRAAVAPDAPIVVSTIGDVSEVETSTPLGRMISEQVASRLVLKGYRVRESKLRGDLNVKQGLNNPAESGEFLISRDASAVAREVQAAAAVTGTYADAGDRILVNLKLIDMASGRVVSAEDFLITKNAAISSLMSNRSSKSGFFGSGWAY